MRKFFSAALVAMLLFGSVACNNDNHNHDTPERVKLHGKVFPVIKASINGKPVNLLYHSFSSINAIDAEYVKQLGLEVQGESEILREDDTKVVGGNELGEVEVYINTKKYISEFDSFDMKDIKSLYRTNEPGEIHGIVGYPFVKEHDLKFE